VCAIGVIVAAAHPPFIPLLIETKRRVDVVANDARWHAAINRLIFYVVEECFGFFFVLLCLTFKSANYSLKTAGILVPLNVTRNIARGVEQNLKFAHSTGIVLTIPSESNLPSK
jgi:hypothetical protein